MTRLFTGYSICLKALVLLSFLAQSTVSSLYADVHADDSPIMLSIPTQTIVAEQPFTYRIFVDSVAEQVVGLRLINAPKGAMLTDNGDNSHNFSWTPPANVDEQTVIIVQAFNVAKPNLISTQRVVLKKGSAEQAKAAALTNTATNTAGVVTASIATPTTTSTATSQINPTANNIESSTDKTAKTLGAKVITAANTTADKSSIKSAFKPASNAALSTATPTKAKVVIGPSSVSLTEYTSKFKTKPAVSAEASAIPSVALSKLTLSKLKESSSATGGFVGDENVPKVNTTMPSSSPEPAANSSATEESIISDRPTLPELGPQRLTVGEEFQIFIRPVAPVDAQLQLSAESMPLGATFEDVFEGSKMLRWTPTPDQLGEHQMRLVLVAEDATDLSLRTERDVMFSVEPAPVLDPGPELVLEPMPAQIVSAGRKINIRVEPKVSDDKLALLQVDRLPAGGSFDENKDGTRTFHWPTTQADQGEHTFRFTATHPEDAELVANVNVLIVVGSPDGPATGPNNPAVSEEYAPPSPTLDEYPSADSPPPPPPGPSVSAASPPPSPESPSAADSPSPEPYPSADAASPEPLAVRPQPQARPTPD